MQNGKKYQHQTRLIDGTQKLYTKFYEIQMTPLDTDPKLEIPM